MEDDYIKGIVFRCLRCGKCCRNLLTPDWHAGLMLLPNEIKLFNKKHIKPCLAVGKSPTHRNFRIGSYQLIQKVCPYLKNNNCSIFEKRPLMCRAYPFRERYYLNLGYIYEIAPECSFHIQLKKDYPHIDEFEFENLQTSIEIVALKKIRNKLSYYLKIKQKKDRQWVFKLNTDKWEPLELR